MSDWVFDLGNSRLKAAPLVEGGVGECIATAHADAALGSGWLQRLPASMDVAYVASVAPPALRDALLAGLRARAARVELVRVVESRAGIRIAYADPSRLGVDRFLAMIAARARSTRPALVVGIGTATTIDLLDGTGLHRGGRIAPSPRLMREAMHQRAPHLPLDGGEVVDFATDTADALASGCVGAVAALVQRSRDDAAALLGEVPLLLLHGGGAEACRPFLPGAVAAPTLVLGGLARIARADGG